MKNHTNIFYFMIFTLRKINKALTFLKSVFNKYHSQLFLYIDIINTQILYYDRIDVSESTDGDKKSASNESIICHYWYFLDKGSKFFWAFVCNGCHYVLMMSTKVKHNCHFKYLWYRLSLDYHHIVGISKRESIDLLKNGDFNENSGSL